MSNQTPWGSNKEKGKLLTRILIKKFITETAESDYSDQEIKTMFPDDANEILNIRFKNRF